MDYKIEFKESFLDDLEQIVGAVARENPLAARRLGERIVQMAESLAFFPERHPRVRQRPSLRRYVTARCYKVFYRIRAEERLVEILRCWAGRRGNDPSIGGATVDNDGATGGRREKEKEKDKENENEGGGGEAVDGGRKDLKPLNAEIAESRGEGDRFLCVLRELRVERDWV